MARPALQDHRQMYITVQRPVYTQAKLDEVFGLQDGTTSLKTTFKSYLHSKAKCSPQCLKDRLLPFVNTLRTYQWKRWLLRDLLAGLTVGSVHIPQGMGFATLASLPAEYGLYSSLFPAFIYFFLGTSRHISIGTMAIISLMIGAIVDREAESQSAQPWLGHGNASAAGETETGIKVGIAMSVSLMVGIFQVAMSCLSLGAVVAYMSTPFVGGFLTGAAFHIAASQLPALLGLSIKSPTGVFKLLKTCIEILRNMPNAEGVEVLVAFICLTVLILLKEVLNPRCRDRLPVPIPAELILVVLATAVSHAANLNGRFGIQVIGHIPRGIPTPRVPSMQNASNYIVDSFVIALVGFTVCISMAEMYSRRYKYPVDSNQELLAYGLTNAVGSFLHSFAGAQAPPRTIIHDQAGGKTQVASLFSCMLLLMVCLVLAPVFESLPKCTLGCIVVVAIFPLFKQFRDLKMLWIVNVYDFSVWVITWASVFLLDLGMGLGVGLAANVFLFLLQAQMAKMTRLGWAEDTDLYLDLKGYKAVQEKEGVMIFHVSSPLFFANVDLFKQQLFAETVDSSFMNSRDINREKETADPPTNNADCIHEGKRGDNGVALHKLEHRVGWNNVSQTTEFRAARKAPNTIILDGSGLTYIDLMGLQLLKQLKRDFSEQGIHLCMANLQASLVKKLRAVDTETEIEVYPALHDAVITHTADAAAADRVVFVI